MAGAGLSMRGWTPWHTLATMWAFYFGPFVILYVLDRAAFSMWVNVALPVFAATGWLVPWWGGVLTVSGASVVLGWLGPREVDLEITGIPFPIAIYLVALVFLAGGRLARIAWDRAHGERRSKARQEQMAIAFRAASHEVGNALMPIRAQLAVLRRDERVHAAADLAEGVARLERGADRLTNLVGEFQTVAASLQGRLVVVPRPVDLAVPLADLAHGQWVLAKARNLTLHANIASQLPCTADADRIVQATANLCQNAIRYTPSGGSITLEAACDEAGIHVRVTDTGVGLEPSSLPHLFRPLSRLRPHSGEGAGLGLWIVHSIMAAHGGSVTAESAGPGRGATFTLRLPPRPAQAAPHAPTPVAAQA